MEPNEKIHNPLIARAVVAVLALVMAPGLLAQVPGYTIATIGSYANLPGIAADVPGNVYISDDQAAVIRRISTTGTTSVVAGGGTCSGGLIGDGGPATSACLSSAGGLAFDAAGNLYIADTGNNRIRKVSSTSGTITTVAGPGTINILGDGGPATSASLRSPKGVAVDSAGNIYIADTNHNVVRIVSPDGTINTFAGQASSTYVTPLGDGGPATSGALSGPEGVALDSAGNLYIADSSDHRVREVSTAGIITTVAGNGTPGYTGDGGLATIASIYLPWGVALDAAGDLYIIDSGNNRLRVVTANGTINTIAGGGTNSSPKNNAATNAVLENLVGVALGAGGNVYVSGFPPISIFPTISENGLQVLTPTGTTFSPAPSIAPNSGDDVGVASASGWGQFSQLGLGSWVSIYGSYLASDSRSWAGSDFNGINAPTSLDGTSVTIGGQSAFISYISPGQINAQVPTNIGTGTQPLIVTTANGTSATFPVTVNPQEPGLLAPASFKIGGTQYAVALFQDGTYVLPTGAIAGVPSRPAQPGEVITLYGIGFGRVVPDTAAGQIVQATATLAAPFQMFFDFSSQAAQVGYAGLAPGVVGLYQFNVTVPTTLSSSRASSPNVSFTLGGVAGTQDLSIAVQ